MVAEVKVAAEAKAVVAVKACVEPLEGGKAKNAARQQKVQTTSLLSYAGNRTSSRINSSKSQID